MKTHSTQTKFSHFKRDAETQVTVQKPLSDGTMPGVSTQVGISKGTNTDSIKTHIIGLRGDYDSKIHAVTVNSTQISDSMRGATQSFIPKKDVKKVSTGV